jgi:hypothetical protein
LVIIHDYCKTNSQWKFILLNVNGFAEGIINIIGMGKISLLMGLEINVSSEIPRSVASYAII